MKCSSTCANPITARRTVRGTSEQVSAVPGRAFAPQSALGAACASREHVGDRLQERALLLAERVLARGRRHERAVDLVAGVDRHADAGWPRASSAPQAAISRGPSSTATRSTPSVARDALRGLLAQLARARRRAARARRARRPPPAARTAGAAAPRSPGARRCRARSRAAAGPSSVCDDPPAHLADELAAVLAPPVGALGEAQRVLELEVQLEVAPVALAHALAATASRSAARSAPRGGSRTAPRRAR